METAVDRKSWLARENRENLTEDVMKWLDGLAALCVANDNDKFATAFDNASSALYLASNHPTSVPDSASGRITAAINFMLGMVEERQGQPPPTQEQLQALRSGFIKEQFRFSEGALTARIRRMDSVLQALDYVLSAEYKYSTAAERRRSSLSYRGRFNSEERDFMQELRGYLRAILAESFLEPSFPVLYIALQGISSLMQRLVPFETLHKTLVMVGHAVDVPITYHVQRLLAIVEGIDAVVNCTSNHSLRDQLKLIHIAKVEPGTGTLKLNPDDKILRMNIGRPFRMSVEGPHPYFDNVFETHILGPLRMVYSEYEQKYGPPQDECIFTVPLHPEARLFQLIHDCVTDPVPYIGLSELACAACFDFILSHDEDCKNPDIMRFEPYAQLRGTHGRVDLPWGAPELSCGENKIFKSQFFDRLGTRFLSSRDVFETSTRPR